MKKKMVNLSNITNYHIPTLFFREGYDVEVFTNPQRSNNDAVE